MGPGVMAFVQIGESGKAVGCGLLRLPAAVHLGIDGQCAFPCVDHLAFESDNVTGENGKLEVDAMEHQQNGILGVDILCHGEIGAFQKPLGASSSKEGLMVVQVSEFDQTL